MSIYLIIVFFSYCVECKTDYIYAFDMETISTKKFVKTFCDISKNKDRRFCFVLGAGASKSSGIRTGVELAKTWLSEIKNELGYTDEEYQQFVSAKKINHSYPGLNYPDIYEERFKLDPETGFHRINKEMENATPGYGYSVLSQILSEYHHNIVITTNFDTLTEEALYTYTSKRPLVCGHELLADFAKPSIDRPLIIKIHRDRFLNPQNTKEGTGELSSSWVDVLNSIFNNCIPVFIGYGGNDGSLMNYLHEIKQFSNLFWCEMKGTQLSESVKRLLEDKGGKHVEVDGFDELMFWLQDGLNLEVLDSKIQEVADVRRKKYRDVFERIQKEQATSQDADAKAAADRLVEKVDPNEWWSWELKAREAKNSDERGKIYLEAIDKLPNSPELNGSYAIFLKNVLNDYDAAENFYKKSVELNPDNALLNSNYAVFLNDIRRNFKQAEKFYKKALEIEPDDATINCNYANLLRVRIRNFDQAEIFYKKALEIEPNNPFINASYANFLNDTHNYEHAEKFYIRALEITPDDANINGNYARVLLAKDRKEQSIKYLDKAERNCYHESIKAELLFYRYAHFEENRVDSLKQLKELICSGIRSVGFTLQDNVDTAIKKGHPEPELLQRLADIITKDAPIGDLCNG